ncbi:MAG: hypothetical protein LC126_14125 [Bryobacterales bacterium]|nr:hypothetical protein [Bryobacterales bacterium]
MAVPERPRFNDPVADANQAKLLAGFHGNFLPRSIQLMEVVMDGKWPLAGAILLLLFAVPSQSQQVPAKPPHDPMEDIAGMAYGMPPEFGADVLLRLAELAPARKRRELLDSAFLLAGRVRQPLAPWKYIGRNGDTRAGYQEYASDLHIDRLSLSVRAAAAMAAIDKSRAIEMFLEIQKPQSNAGGCKAPLVPNASIYYDELGKLAAARGTLTKPQSEDLDLLLDRAIASISVTPDVLAAARMLIASNSGRDRMQAFLGGLAGAMLRVDGDFRSFVTLTSQGIDVFYTLLQRAQRNGIDTRPFAHALRQYIVTNLKSPPCPDLLARLQNTGRGSAPGRRQLDLDKIPLAAGFNGSVVSAFPSGSGVSAITSEEIRPPEQVSEMIDDIVYFTAGTARSLKGRIREVFRSQSSAKRNALSKMQLEDAVRDIIEDLRSWKPDSGESYPDYYNQKVVLYFSLIDALPAGSSRDRATQYLGEFIDGSYDRIVPKSEWFHFAHRFLVGQARESSQGEAFRILAARSQNNVLAGYAQLWRWRHSPQ